MSETEKMLVKHLTNMLAVIAADRESLKIERGSAVDKEIVAARKAIIDLRFKYGEWRDMEREI